MRKGFSMLAALAGLATAGCSTSETLHNEGVTSYAGDAIAANTMLQIVDPWQYGVQFTDLKTPATRPASIAPAPSADSATMKP